MINSMKNWYLVVLSMFLSFILKKNFSLHSNILPLWKCVSMDDKRSLTLVPPEFILVFLLNNHACFRKTVACLLYILPSSFNLVLYH